MAHCKKHGVDYNSLLWCPMCLIDDMDDREDPEDDKYYATVRQEYLTRPEALCNGKRCEETK